MTTAKWIITGLAISGFASMLHLAGNAGFTLADRLPYYVPLVLAAAGQFCLYRGLRSAIGDVWSGLFGKARKEKVHAAPRRTSGFGHAGDDGPMSDFDADAAFARFMEQRSAETTPPAPASLSPRPARTPAVRPQGGFGRKVI